MFGIMCDASVALWALNIQETFIPQNKEGLRQPADG